MHCWARSVRAIKSGFVRVLATVRLETGPQGRGRCAVQYMPSQYMQAVAPQQSHLLGRLPAPSSAVSAVRFATLLMLANDWLCFSSFLLLPRAIKVGVTCTAPKSYSHCNACALHRNDDLLSTLCCGACAAARYELHDFFLFFFSIY